MPPAKTLSGKKPKPETCTTKDVDERVSIAMAMEFEDAKAAGALGFQAHALTLTTLPHSKLVGADGQELREYSRTNGRAHLAVQAGPAAMPGTGLAYGAVPRLALIHIASEAKKTNCPEIDLGLSMAGFMRALGMGTTGGKRGSYKALNTQIFRLFTSSLTTWEEGDGVVNPLMAWDSFRLVQSGSIWWSPLNPEQETLWKSTITLTEKAFSEITYRAVPTDLRGLRDATIHKSPLALDLYVWLPYRSFTATASGRVAQIPWWGLMRQFGAGYAQTAQGMRNFRKEARTAIQTVLSYYPRLRVDASGSDYLVISPNRASVAGKSVD